MSTKGEVISAIVTDMPMIDVNRQTEIDMMLNNEQDEEAEKALREEITSAVEANVLTPDLVAKYLGWLDNPQSAAA